MKKFFALLGTAALMSACTFSISTDVDTEEDMNDTASSEAMMDDSSSSEEVMDDMVGSSSSEEAMMDDSSSSEEMMDDMDDSSSSEEAMMDDASSSEDAMMEAEVEIEAGTSDSSDDTMEDGGDGTTGEGETNNQ